MKKKTQIDDIDRGIYDVIDEVKTGYMVEKGITEDIVREISREKNEPEWMLNLRLEALEIFRNSKDPDWGPDLSELNLDEIVTYIRPDAKKQASWDNVPQEIKNTFDRLGIPDAEKKYLGGVSAQFDSEEVYHNVKSMLLEQGVIYMDISEAVRKHEDLVKKYFAKAIKPTLHKYAALHLAVWSGGSFVYVPKGVKVDIPIQSYYRLNAPGAGQFEHTLIVADEDASITYIEGCSAPKYNVLNIHAGSVEIFVEKNGQVRFSTIENWSKNMYNLNTKRAIVKENGKVEWIAGSFGSRVSMLYPTSVLQEKGASSEFVGITFAGKDQRIDNGCAAIHLAEDTYSAVSTKAITKDNGISITRNFVYIDEKAKGSRSNSDCESLMLDKSAVSDTIPLINVKTNEADVGHEAKIGKIGDEQIFYLMSRGLTKDEAKAMVVRGFAEPVSKELPVEYAVEMNHLIELELEGTNG